MLHRFVFLFFLIAITSPSILRAQSLGNSPYSRVGIGDMVEPLTVHNLGAGGLSISNYNQEHLELNNPAMSTNKRGLYRDSLVKIEGGFTLQYKQFSTASSSNSVTAANLRYLAFSIPISKTWNTTIAIQPYAIKNHNYTMRSPIINDPNGYDMEYSFQGKGGVYQLAFNNGVGINKSLSAGLGLAYLFGPTNVTSTSVLVTNPYATTQNEFKYGVKKRISHRSLGIKPALHYRKEFYKVKDSTMVKYPQGVFWNVGLTGEFYTPLNMKVQETLIRETPTGTVSEDSVLDEYKVTGSLPTRINLGFSIDRPNRWMVGVQGGFSNWGTGFDYDAISSATYKLAWNVGVGGEYRSNSRRRQQRAWTYRAGFNYATLPYVLSDTQIKDVSASLGASIPVGVRGIGGALPKINIALVVGQRGTLENGLALERYFRVQLSVLITDKWFTKRKIQ